MQKKESHIEKLRGEDEVTQEMVWTHHYDDVSVAQKEKAQSKWWQCQNLHGKWWGETGRLRVRP